VFEGLRDRFKRIATREVIDDAGQAYSDVAGHQPVDMGRDGNRRSRLHLAEDENREGASSHIPARRGARHERCHDRLRACAARSRSLRRACGRDGLVMEHLRDDQLDRILAEFGHLIGSGADPDTLAKIRPD
jgi:hypothetical protein